MWTEDEVHSNWFGSKLMQLLEEHDLPSIDIIEGPFQDDDLIRYRVTFDDNTVTEVRIHTEGADNYVR